MKEKFTCPREWSHSSLKAKYIHSNRSFILVFFKYIDLWGAKKKITQSLQNMAFNCRKNSNETQSWIACYEQDVKKMKRITIGDKQ